MNMKTSTIKNGEHNKKWVIIDAKDQLVGRLASDISRVLRGKHKPTFTPHLDCGDNVVVINAGKVRFSGNKIDQKVYYHHTGYIGGIKATSARNMLDKHPERVIFKAVKGMLPKNKLSNKILKNLRVFAGEEHTQKAQAPAEFPQRIVGESK